MMGIFFAHHLKLPKINKCKMDEKRQLQLLKLYQEIELENLKTLLKFEKNASRIDFYLDKILETQKNQSEIQKAIEDYEKY